MAKKHIRKVAVLGLGGVGELAARLLTATGFEVTGVDLRIADGSWPFAVATASAADPDALESILEDLNN